MKIFEKKGYVYKRLISTGGQGKVHLLERNGQFYIAKIFSKLDDDVLLLLKHIQEIKAPNVPKIHEIYNEKDKTIIIRDYIDGHTLYEEIQKKGMLTLERAKYIILKICETLEVLHKTRPNPIVYRDLKPENIMISKTDDVFLIDFGIARYHKAESNRDTMLIGTIGYTAPEVMAGMQTDNRSDIYSVGLLFYEMLTGKNLLVPPYQIRPVKESNEKLSKKLDKVIKKATEISMVMRYRDIREVADIIRKIAPERSKKAKRILFSAAVIAGLAVFVLGYVVLEKDWFPLNNKEQEMVVEDGNPEAYSIMMDLEFEDLQDFSWMQLVGQKVESGEINETDYPNLIDGGVYSLKAQTMMNYKLVPGSFVHFRVLPGEADRNGALFFLSFVPELGRMAAYNIPFSNHSPASAEIVDDFGFYSEEAFGSSILVEHKWMDVLVYLDTSGQTLRYIISDLGDETAIAFGGVRVLEEWVGREYQIEINVPFEYWENELGVGTPISQFEFIRYGDGSLTDYLKINMPAYINNRQQVDDFLKSDLDLVSHERFTPHENR